MELSTRARTRKVSRVSSALPDERAIEVTPSSPTPTRRRILSPGIGASGAAGAAAGRVALPAVTSEARRNFTCPRGSKAQVFAAIVLLLFSLVLWAQSHFRDVSLVKDVQWLVQAAARSKVYGVESDRQRIERHFYEAPAHDGDFMRLKVDALHEHLKFVDSKTGNSQSFVDGDK